MNTEGAPVEGENHGGESCSAPTSKNHDHPVPSTRNSHIKIKKHKKAILSTNTSKKPRWPRHMHSHPSHNHLASNHKVPTPSKCHPDATVHPPPTTYPGSLPPVVRPHYPPPLPSKRVDLAKTPSPLSGTSHTTRNSSHSGTMPLQHTMTYQAFCEITNFIRDNGDD